MFDKDQAAIERWCKNPDKLLDVGTMVLLSIRMQWTSVGNQMYDVRKHGSKSKCLWGFKRDGYIYLRDNRKVLYKHVRDYRAGRIWLDDLVREFLKVPGLGLAKAGFLAQLTTGHGGCLDMHNVARFGLSPDSWKIRPRVDVADQLVEIDSKISFYLHLCDACGGSEKLWDDWCNYLNDAVSTFNGAEDVSRRHVTYLKGE